MRSGIDAFNVVFVYFGIGVALRATGIAGESHAQFVLRLVFFVTLPALAFLAISEQPFAPEKLLLPLAAIAVNLACMFCSLAYVRIAGFGQNVAGTVILGSSVANVAFVIPFIEYGLGPAALAAVVLYDAGNAIFVATGSNFVAARSGGNEHSSVVASLLQVSRTPLLIAVAVAMAASASQWTVPAAAGQVLQPLARMTAPLVLIAMGALFTTRHLTRSPVLGAVVTRMLGGFVFGLALVLALGLNGPAAVAITAAAAAPIGFNAVTLASVNRLDVDIATASLILSVVIGLVTTAFIVLFGGSLIAQAASI